MRTSSKIPPLMRWAQALAALVFGGCAIGTSFPHWGTGSGTQVGTTDETVLLVITRVVVNHDQRREFDRQTGLVIKSMPSHPGLLGYSARRELFGDQAWTISAWTDDDARRNFMRSAVHQEAIKKSEPAIVTVESKRLRLPRSELPNSWVSALALFSGSENKRTYIH